MGHIIGIDLGTTNSCVSILEGNEPIVVHNQEGGRTTPSVVAWDLEGGSVVGAPAKRQMVTNPTRTVHGAKRLIGCKADSDQLSGLISTLPYPIIAADNGDAWIEIEGKQYSPQEVSAHILRKMKQVAEDYLGEEVSEAVITVPAYFDDVQRQATKDAGRIAGLDVCGIVNEPTAAALAYGAHRDKDQRIAVFDLGGGTFDISILAVESGVFEVLATHGDTHLGGDDFDRALIEMLAGEFKEEHGIDLTADMMALQRLKEAAERCKVELSAAMVTDINLPFLAAGPEGPLHLEREVRRSEFETLCTDLLERLEGPCRTALDSARVQGVDQVLLVGGMTRMPIVQQRVLEIFDLEPSKGVNPDEIVAMGAAVQSGIMSGEIREVILLDVTPHSLGLRTAGGKLSVVIPANSTIPTRAQKTFTTTEDAQTFVSIDIFQGDVTKPGAECSLGRFHLGNLPEKPKGTVRVQVSFTVDADGILHVSAVESGTGNEASVTVEASSGLEESELSKLVMGG